MAQTKITVDGITDLTSSAAELNYVDITTLGTAQASKVLTADANVDVGLGLRNLTGTGFLQGGTILVKGTTNSITIDADNPSAYTVVLPNNAPSGGGKVLQTASGSQTQLEWGTPAGGASIGSTPTENQLVTVANTTSNLDSEDNLTFNGTDVFNYQHTGQHNFNLATYSTTDSTHALLNIQKSAHGTLGNTTGALGSGDIIGQIQFQGSQGSIFVTGASIKAESEEASSWSNGRGTKLSFLTCKKATHNTLVPRMIINNEGQVTKPYNSCGLVRVVSDINNQTGNESSSAYQVSFSSDPTSCFDQNGDWSNSANTFYAPVTGRYLWNVKISFKDNLSTASTDIWVALTSDHDSGSTYTIWHWPGRPDGIGTGNSFTVGGSIVVELDAGEYINCKVRVNGEGANDVQIEGGGSFASYLSWCLLG